jgi:curved DNA-binding protein CbpA
MKWFTSCKSEAEIKTAYRNLAKKHHPDMQGGDTATMQEINAEYEAALKMDYTRQGYDEAKASARWDLDKEIMEKAQEILRLSRALEVEVCGVWLWITGDTRTVKDGLKALACRWSPKKLAWYFRREQDGCGRWHKKTLSLDQIRMRYGSAAIRSESEGQNCPVVA